MAIGFNSMNKKTTRRGNYESGSDYVLEYGTATLELHSDSIRPGQRVLVVDDVLATGGTLAAAVALVEQLGGVVTAVSVVVELAALGGRERVAPHTVHALWTT